MFLQITMYKIRFSLLEKFQLNLSNNKKVQNRIDKNFFKNNLSIFIF